VAERTVTRRVDGDLVWCEHCYESRGMTPVSHGWSPRNGVPLVRGFCPQGHPVALAGWELKSYVGGSPWWRLGLWWWLVPRRKLLVLRSLFRLRKAQRDERRLRLTGETTLEWIDRTVADGPVFRH
jgi:hypothetical protein